MQQSTTVYKLLKKLWAWLRTNIQQTIERDKDVDVVAENTVKIQFNPKGYLGKGVDKIVDKGVNKNI